MALHRRKFLYTVKRFNMLAILGKNSHIAFKTWDMSPVRVGCVTLILIPVRNYRK